MVFQEYMENGSSSNAVTLAGMIDKKEDQEVKVTKYYLFVKPPIYKPLKNTVPSGPHLSSED